MQWPIVHPAGIALHVVRRSRARTACFFGESDRLEFLGGLREYAVQYACAVHAYVLMGNHVPGGLSAAVQRQALVPDITKLEIHGRSSPL